MPRSAAPRGTRGRKNVSWKLSAQAEEDPNDVPAEGTPPPTDNDAGVKNQNRILVEGSPPDNAASPEDQAGPAGSHPAAKQNTSATQNPNQPKASTSRQAARARPPEKVVVSKRIPRQDPSEDDVNSDRHLGSRTGKHVDRGVIEKPRSASSLKLAIPEVEQRLNPKGVLLPGSKAAGARTERSPNRPEDVVTLDNQPSSPTEKSIQRGVAEQPKSPTSLKEPVSKENQSPDSLEAIVIEDSRGNTPPVESFRQPQVAVDQLKLALSMRPGSKAALIIPDSPESSPKERPVDHGVAAQPANQSSSKHKDDLKDSSEDSSEDDTSSLDSESHHARSPRKLGGLLSPLRKKPARRVKEKSGNQSSAKSVVPKESQGQSPSDVEKQFFPPNQLENPYYRRLYEGVLSEDDQDDDQPDQGGSPSGGSPSPIPKEPALHPDGGPLHSTFPNDAVPSPRPDDTPDFADKKSGQESRASESTVDRQPPASAPVDQERSSSPHGPRRDAPTSSPSPPRLATQASKPREQGKESTFRSDWSSDPILPHRLLPGYVGSNRPFTQETPPRHDSDSALSDSLARRPRVEALRRHETTLIGDSSGTSTISSIRYPPFAFLQSTGSSSENRAVSPQAPAPPVATSSGTSSRTGTDDSQKPPPPYQRPRKHPRPADSPIARAPEISELPLLLSRYESTSSGDSSFTGKNPLKHQEPIQIADTPPSPSATTPIGPNAERELDPPAGPSTAKAQRPRESDTASGNRRLPAPAPRDPVLGASPRAQSPLEHEPSSPSHPVVGAAVGRGDIAQAKRRGEPDHASKAPPAKRKRTSREQTVSMGPPLLPQGQEQADTGATSAAASRVAVAPPKRKQKAPARPRLPRRAKSPSRLPSPAVASYRPGGPFPVQRVLAYDAASKVFSPGRVDSLTPNEVVVKFDDGRIEARGLKDLRLCEIRPGDLVQYIGTDLADQESQFTDVREPKRVLRVELSIDDRSPGSHLPGEVVVCCNEERQQGQMRFLLEAIQVIPNGARPHLGLSDRLLPDQVTKIFQELMKSQSGVGKRVETAARLAHLASSAPTHASPEYCFQGLGILVTTRTPAEPNKRTATAFREMIEQHIRQRHGTVIDQASELYEITRVDGDAPQPTRGKGKQRAKVDDDFEACQLTPAPKHQNHRQIILVADFPSKKLKYLIALALGIPCVSTRWVIDSHAQGSALDWERYMIGPGPSAFLGGASAFNHNQSRLLNRSAHNLSAIFESCPSIQLFKGQSFIFVSKAKSRKEWAHDIAPILCAAGASKMCFVKLKDLQGANNWNKTEEFDYILLEDHLELTDLFQAPYSKRRKVGQKAAPSQAIDLKPGRIVNWEWVKQCIIYGHVLDPQLYTPEAPPSNTRGTQ